MSMYKRPPLRVREPPRSGHETAKSTPVGSFLHKITNPPPTTHYKWVRYPVYQKQAYLALLKKNYEENSLEWVEPEISDYEHPQIIEKSKEPELTFIDRVYLNLRFLKSGIIRVKLNTSFVSLFEKYYSKNKLPQIKNVIQAYKSQEFSDVFLERIKKNHEKRIAHIKKVSNAIDLIFNKEPVKKTKKKKEEPKLVEQEEEINDEDEQDQDQEDDGPEEDEALDVEVDEELEEQQEEYFSDGGDD